MKSNYDRCGLFSTDTVTIQLPERQSQSKGKATGEGVRLYLSPCLRRGRAASDAAANNFTAARHVSPHQYYMPSSKRIHCKLRLPAGVRERLGGRPKRLLHPDHLTSLLCRSAIA